ncbi:MAG: hypothetical protein B6D42_08565 [Anaerolineae bacterium UTCFX5]|nr:MAG: hypothetical protein B6D42_08565 [Anaerolineae bacterium UTCFX5]
MPTRYLKSTSASKRSLKHGDLVIEISGGSPTQSTGRVVRLHQSLLDHVPFEVSCSNFCRLVRLQTPELSSYAYFWLRWLYATDALLPYETGTTGIKNFAYTVFSDQHRMLIPNRTVLEAFDRTVSPMVDQMQANGIQSLTLAEMRDALLPRLMRGELVGV